MGSVTHAGNDVSVCPIVRWCYGATVGLEQLAADQHTRIRMQPTGLFARNGRVVDAGFAKHAWRNNQKIAALTGLPFNATYRTQLLSGDCRAFDSWPMVLALSAVEKTEPEQEIEILKTFQAARYQYARDTSDIETVKTILNEIGLTRVTALVGSDEVAAAAEQRILEGQALMRQFDLSGVPGLLRRREGQDVWQVADSRVLFESAK